MSVSSRFKNLDVRFQEYPPFAKLQFTVVGRVVVVSVAGQFLEAQAVNEAAVTRGSRTRNMPLATRCRSRVRLTRNSFRKARCDQPSVTFALIPRAPNRKRTARTE